VIATRTTPSCQLGSVRVRVRVDVRHPPFFCEHFFFFTHPKGCWSSSCCSQSLQATGSVVRSYWSLMAPWLRGISICFRKPRNQRTGKGRSGLRFEKQREDLESRQCVPGGFLVTLSTGRKWEGSSSYAESFKISRCFIPAK
jgi:hypothetical protein